ncbi:phage gp6-like head-tail connector protein [Acinetobacter seifertii]|uniref:head-tail connector protein n=1 Tax=Acinetobacter seifertii TaxID=1530123 RepID=UPI000C223404|nr:head-tail connector protein [Acinetobacter seifertii]PJG66757.1 phage gp6-like head-tail connector protein [Acinetobacter seifertii]QNY13533.1 phage gp6-like head-tail connector protein [Acinetobacter seifertii]
MSDYIALDLAKSHLRVLHARDDSYIELLIKAALKAVRNYIDRDFAEVQLKWGVPTDSLPEDLIFAALLIIGDMYQNRAAQSDAALHINIACERLMNPYEKKGVK